MARGEPSGRTLDVAVLGHVRGPSGAGLIHEQLGHHLAGAADGLRLVRVDPVADTVPSIGHRLARRVRDVDVVVWTSTPLPLRVTHGAALVPVVYDLRWLRTRRLPARVYRAADLARQVRRCHGILTISETVAAQLTAFTARPIGVLPMGPGQFEGYPAPPPRNTRTIVLMGDAAHKHNELAARMLCASPLVRDRYTVVAVHVSEECRRILRAGMPDGCVEVHGVLPRDQLAAIFERSSTYLALGTAEGFGLPYVEAAYFGCDVVAPDVPLTREVLGSSGRLLPSATPTVDDLERALAAWDEARVTGLQAGATARSWTDTATRAATFIRSLVAGG